MAWWDAGRRGAGLLPRSCRGSQCETVWRLGGRESIFKIRHTNEFCGKSKLARETARASGRLGEPRGTYKRNSAGRGPGRGGLVFVLLLLAFDVCIYLVVWSVVRLVRQKVILTLIVHGLMRSVGVT